MITIGNCAEVECVEAVLAQAAPRQPSEAAQRRCKVSGSTSVRGSLAGSCLTDDTLAGGPRSRGHRSLLSGLTAVLVDLVTV